MVAERTAPRVRSVPEDHVVLLHRQPHVAHLHAVAGFDPVTSAASPSEGRLAEIVAVYVVGVVIAENAIEDAAGWCRERGVAAAMATAAAAAAAEAVVEVGRAGLRRRAVLLGVVGIVIVVRIVDWKITYVRACDEECDRGLFCMVEVVTLFQRVI